MNPWGVPHRAREQMQENVLCIENPAGVKDRRRCLAAIVGSALKGGLGGATVGAGTGIWLFHLVTITVPLGVVVGAVGSGLQTYGTADPCAKSEGGHKP